MRTDGRTPIELGGIDRKGELGESLDQVVRDSIAPRLDYQAKVIDNREGKPCLVVEVPRGPSRPCLVTTTGQVMRRTQTATVPADREYLDRLFLEGRSGILWAREVIASELADMANMPEAAIVWTVPAVEDGLGVGNSLFTHESWERLLSQASRFPGITSFWRQNTRHDVSDTFLMASVPDLVGDSIFHLRSIRRGW